MTKRTKRSNGEGTYQHVGPGKWRGRVTIGHKFNDDGERVPIRKKVTGTTQKEVRLKIEEITGKLDSGEPVLSESQGTLTVAEWVTTWLEGQRGKIAAATHDQYAGYTKVHLIPNLGSIPLHRLTPGDVERMLNRMEKDGKSANTRRIARAVLRRSLRYAERDGLVTRNAAALADAPKVGTNRRAEGMLTAGEVRNLIAYVKSEQAPEGVRRIAASWIVAVAVGLRRSELLGLEWANVDLREGLIHVELTLKATSNGLVLSDPKTVKSRRQVNLPSFAVEALEAHRKTQTAERLKAGPEWVPEPLGADLVFRTPFGTPIDPDNWSARTQSVTKASTGTKHSPHVLRHTAASLLIAEGVPLKKLADTLGHTSIVMTANVYGHLYPADREEVADAMSKALGL